MTQQEAVQEARRRWGKDGRAKSEGYWPYGYGIYPKGSMKKVGIKVKGSIRWKGLSGESFEAAFADADRREREK